MADSADGKLGGDADAIERRRDAFAAAKRKWWCLITLLTVAGLLVGYLLFWPVPIRPERWNAPVSKGYIGRHAVNNRLADLQTIRLDNFRAAEHIIAMDDGSLLAAMESGCILRVDPAGDSYQVHTRTNGRPLGFAEDAEGRLIVADAVRGLLSIDKTGQVQVLADSSSSPSVRFANSVVVATDGTIYFTDSSQRFYPTTTRSLAAACSMDILEQSATGRVLAYQRGTKPSTTERLHVVARGLSFANGITLTEDETKLLVAETGRYRVWEIIAKTSDIDVSIETTETRILLDNLPGFPDNLTRGKNGKIWLGLPTPRIDSLDRLDAWPLIRKIIHRLPDRILGARPIYGHAIAFDEQGKIVADLQDPTGTFPLVTGITETKQRLYVQTLNGFGIGWMPTIPATFR